jgi:hypothetical protein
MSAFDLPDYIDTYAGEGADVDSEFPYYPPIIPDCILQGEWPCLPAALTYAARGWVVFPVVRGQRKSHKSSRHSNGRRWGATKDPEEIRQDYARWPEANVGIPTGKENTIWVLEIDTVEGHNVDGIASLRQLVAKHGALPQTLMARSPSGSLHHYFNWPADRVISNSASKIAPGIDVRGEGGMVLAPPSLKPFVGVYSWICNAEIVDAPDWLLALAVAAGNSTGTSEPNADLEAPLPKTEAAVNAIPNPDLDWESWNTRGMAICKATGGSTDGFILFDRFSRKSKKYDARITMERWQSYQRYPPDRIGFGSLSHWAYEADPDWYRNFAAQAAMDQDEAPKEEEQSKAEEATKDEEQPKTEEAPRKEEQPKQDSNKTKSNSSDAKSEESDLHIVQVSEVEAKAYNWLWKSRIARGKVSLLVGMPDVNKSTLALDLTARITKNSLLPNNEGRAPPGSVIILSAEDDVADTIRPRLEVASAALERVHVITAVKLKKGGRRTFDLTQDILQLEKAVRIIGDVIMIIIDPYSAYMGKPGKLDTYRSTDVRATLAPLFDMAARLEVAVLGIGHLNKSGSMPALLRVLDSVAFVAASRSVYLVARDPENDERRLFVPAKNNIGKIRTGLAFRIIEKLATTVFDAYPTVKWEEGDVTITADEVLAWKEDGRTSEAAQKAKAFLLRLLAKGPMKQKEVQAKAAEQQVAPKSLRNAKAGLGVVSTRILDAWWWSLPGQDPPI